MGAAAADAPAGVRPGRRGDPALRGPDRGRHRPRCFGQPILASAGIGAALALSSTAIIVPALVEGKRLHSDVGRTAFSMLLFQDLAVAPILVALSLMHGNAQTSGWGILLKLAPAIIMPVVILLAGRLLLRPMMKSVARAKSEELFMACSLLVVLGAGLASAAAGQSMALGAFIAGLLLAETEYRHEVEVTIEPFKGLLLGLFFLSVGIGLDLGRLVQQPALILGAAVGLVVLKAVVTAVGRALLFRLRLRRALEIGLILGAGGEFAFVVLGDAMGAGLIGREAGETLIVAATLSMFAIPALTALGARIGRSRAPLPELPAVSADEPPRVLVIGYGRVGLMVADMLDRHQIAWVAIDRDPKLAEAGRKAGHTVFFGDGGAGRLHGPHRPGQCPRRGGDDGRSPRRWRRWSPPPARLGRTW